MIMNKKLFTVIIGLFVSATILNAGAKEKFNQSQKIQDLPEELQGHVTGFLAQSPAKTKPDFLNWITEYTVKKQGRSYDSIYAVALSGDGSTLVVVEGKQLVIWKKDKHAMGPQAADYAPWQLKQVIADANLDGFYARCKLSFDGKVLLYNSREKAYVYEQTAAEYIQKQIIGHAKTIKSTALSYDGSTVVTGGDDERTQVYKKDKAGQWQRQIFQGSDEIRHTLFDAPIASVAVNYNGTILASGAGDTLVWWLNKQKVWERDRIKIASQSVVLNKVGNIILIAGLDLDANIQKIEIWQQPKPFAHWQQLQSIPMPINFFSSDFVALSHDAKTIAYAMADATDFTVYEMDKQNHWRKLKPFSAGYKIQKAAMSAHGKTIVTTQRQTNDIPPEIISDFSAYRRYDFSKVKYFGLNAATIWQNNHGLWKKMNEFDFKGDDVRDIALNDAGTLCAIAHGNNVTMVKQVSQKLIDALSPEQIIFLQDLYTIKQKAIGVPQITFDKKQYELFDVLPAEFKAYIEQNYKIQ